MTHPSTRSRTAWSLPEFSPRGRSHGVRWRGMRGTLTATALTAAALAFSPSAHADPDGDYLNIMANTPGVLGGPINDAIYMSQGYRACDLLSSGVPREDVVGQLTVPVYVQPWLARAMVDAAQSALCPESH